jgi:ribosomal protein S4
MKREELLAKGYTEEQVTDILNTFHSISSENKLLKNEVEGKQEIINQNLELQRKIDEINQASMSEQEKVEAMKKETEKNLAESRKVYNKAKVKEVLAGYDVEDELINSLVTDDEKTSLNSANILKSRLDTIIANTTKKVQDNIASLVYMYLS